MIFWKRSIKSVKNNNFITNHDFFITNNCLVRNRSGETTRILFWATPWYREDTLIEEDALIEIKPLLEAESMEFVGLPGGQGSRAS